MTGDISPEELRWHGANTADAVATRERLLGTSLEAYKPMAQGQVIPSRVYPAFVPRGVFTVLTDEQLKELNW